mgnify:FL=1
MAELVVTPANVAAYAGADVDHGEIAGEDITAGQVVYKAADGAFYATAYDTAEHAAAYGVALNSAAAGQPLSIIRSGGLNPGAAVVVGAVYVVGSMDGAIAPVTDLVAGEYLTLLGIATTTSRIDLAINRSGVNAPVT